MISRKISAVVLGVTGVVGVVGFWMEGVEVPPEEEPPEEPPELLSHIATDLIIHEGGLNCASWTVRE